MARRPPPPKRPATRGDHALSKLRVVRGTLFGVREAVRDAKSAARALPEPTRARILADLAAAEEFADRGTEKLQDSYAELEAAMTAAGVPFKPDRGRPPTSGPGKVHRDPPRAKRGP